MTLLIHKLFPPRLLVLFSPNKRITQFLEKEIIMRKELEPQCNLYLKAFCRKRKLLG